MEPRRDEHAIGSSALDNFKQREAKQKPLLMKFLNLFNHFSSLAVPVLPVRPIIHDNVACNGKSLKNTDLNSYQSNG